MTRVIVAVWLAGACLALADLLALAGYEGSPGLVVALALALTCYSLPFFLLTRLLPPARHGKKRALVAALAAAIMVIELIIPLRRFLPFYHPSPLEALIYLVAPLLECLPIALVAVIL